MGNNAAILVLTDQLGSIERDPEGFVKEMVNRIQHLGFADKMEEFQPGRYLLTSSKPD